MLEGLGCNPVDALRTLRPEEALVARGLVEIVDARVQPLVQRVTVPARVIDFLSTGFAPEPAPPLVIEPEKTVASLCPMTVREVADDAVAHLRRMFAVGARSARRSGSSGRRARARKRFWRQSRVSTTSASCA